MCHRLLFSYSSCLYHFSLFSLSLSLPLSSSSLLVTTSSGWDLYHLLYLIDLTTELEVDSTRINLVSQVASLPITPRNIPRLSERRHVCCLTIGRKIDRIATDCQSLLIICNFNFNTHILHEIVFVRSLLHLLFHINNHLLQEIDILLITFSLNLLSFLHFFRQHLKTHVTGLFI